MLTSLRIRNLALVEDLAWSLGSGYTAITGETGAGKSIILGALKLLIGERADKTLIRSGADACTVEAAFTVGDSGKTNAQLAELGVEPCEDDQLLLKRSFTASGTNRQFINGSPTTLAVLKTLGEDLVDLHGPHDHQSLFSTARQLAILDQFAGNTAALEKYTALYQQCATLRAEHDSLSTSEAAVAQEIDLLQFQKTEIDAADLDAAEVAETETRYAAIANSRRLIELGAGIRNALTETDDAASTRHTDAARLFRDLERLDPTTAELASRHNALVAELDDLSAELDTYLGKLDLDPDQIATLEDRVNLLQALRRKYGRTIEEVIAHGETVTARLAKITGRDAELQRLDAELKKAEAALQTAGAALTKTREKAIAPLATAVTAQLRDLGFRQSRFEITRLPSPTPRATGFETIEFQFAPNPGEPIQPLRAIASSGEISRVMLAIKTALASQDEVALLVFDEVDANVGGEIAHAVGEKMASLGKHHQVLTITHLPQVAARAAEHFVVAKEVREGRTHSTLTRVEASTRVEEIARMLGGQTKSALEHAATLLGP
jgi:DNA repair protein RecN (Recombination protein N)